MRGEVNGFEIMMVLDVAPDVPCLMVDAGYGSQDMPNLCIVRPPALPSLQQQRRGAWDAQLVAALVGMQGGLALAAHTARVPTEDWDRGPTPPCCPPSAFFHAHFQLCFLMLPQARGVFSTCPNNTWAITL